MKRVLHFVVLFLIFQNIVLLDIVICNYVQDNRLYVFGVFYIPVLLMAEK